MSTPWIRRLLSTLLLAGVYFAAAKFGLMLAYIHPNVSLVWPPTGIALTALLVFGYRLWPGILLGAFLANATTELPPWTALGIATGNALEALLAAFLVNRFVGSWHFFRRTRSMLLFMGLGGMLSPMVSATFGVVSLCLGESAAWSEFLPLWSSWWLGNAMGVVVVASALLSMGEGPWAWQARHVARTALLLAALLAVTLSVFGLLPPWEQHHYPVASLIIPFLTLGAFFFSYRVLTMAIAMVTAIAIWGTLHGKGPFVLDSLNASIFLLQGFLGVTAVTVLLLATVLCERRLAEELSTVAHAESEDLYQNAPCGYLSLDAQGLMTRINDTALHWLGCAREETLGRPLVEFLAPLYRASFEQAFTRSRERAQPANLEVEMIRADGTTQPVALEMTVRSDAAHRFVEGRAIVLDISDLKRAVEEVASRTAELRKSKEILMLKDSILSTFSHEMKTPLSLIAGFAELLQDAYPNEPLIEGILDGERRLAKHLNRILDYSSLVGGAMPLYQTDLNMHEIVENAVTLVQADLAGKGIALQTEVRTGLSVAQGDPRRVTQILLELLENSGKFTPPGGSIGIRVSPQDDAIRIEVWDTGRGIAEGELAQLGGTRPLELAASNRIGGLGLGLVIVRKLVELHGGRMEISSELGKGTRVLIVLPASSDGTLGPAA